MFFTVAVRLLSILIVILIADIWSTRGLEFIFSSKRRFPRRLVWMSSVLFLLFALIVFLRQGMPGLDPVKLRAYYVVSTVFMVIYIPKLLLALPVLAEDIIVLFFNGLGRLMSRKQRFRSRRRKWQRISLLAYPALVVSGLVLLMIAEGVLVRKHSWVVRQVEIPMKSLPDSFDGFRILQISDAHLGSFFSEGAVRSGLALASGTNPDIIVFTGDMVNANFTEARPYMHLFKQLYSNEGKFAVLGNHDMDDYMRWTSDKASEENINGLASFYADAGFNLLRNRSQAIVRGSDTIFIAGVDNWGLPPFRQYGDIAQALKGTGEKTVILLTHDPSHWRSQVLDHKQVALSLSGHTHAMQFGIRIGDWTWSPSSWKYPEWLGVYTDNGQNLHVNPGFGYLGFIGRVGIQPELTLIVLRKNS